MTRTFHFNRAVHTLYAEHKTVVVSKIDVATCELYEVTLPLDIYSRWRNGEDIATLRPGLSLTEREFLLTERTPSEQAVHDHAIPEAPSDSAEPLS